MKPLDRLIEIGQRLDELSETLPELADLSDEIGKIADKWPEPMVTQVGNPRMPEYLERIQQIVERELAYGRRGRGYRDEFDPYSPYYNPGLDPRMLSKTPRIF